MSSTDNYSDKLSRLKDEIATADAIIIGAGAGLSASAGFDYSGERFEKYFADFHEKYGITDMYSGGFYPFETLNEYWAWWSRLILVNRYNVPAGKPYTNLLKSVADKDYFVLTTNVDHQFQLAGFDKSGCSTRREIMAYGNAANRVATKPLTTKVPCGLW